MPVRLEFFLAAFLACASQSAAAVVTDCRTRLAALEAGSGIVPASAKLSDERKARAAADFAREKGKLARWFRRRGNVDEKFLVARSHRLVEAASAQLEARGVAHEIIASDGRIALVILPGSQSLYNRYAAGMARLLPGITIAYDPFWNIKLGYEAAFVPGLADHSPLILVPDSSIAVASPRDTFLVHETQHAQEEAKRQGGSLSPYLAKMVVHRPTESFRLPGEGDLYPTFLKLDELKRYRFGLRSSWRAFLARPHDRELAQTFLTDLEATEQTAERGGEAAAIIAALVETAQPRDLSPRIDFERDGRRFRASFSVEEPSEGLRDLKVAIVERGKGDPKIGFDLEVPVAPTEKVTLAPLREWANVISEASRENLAIVDEASQRLLTLSKARDEKEKRAIETTLRNLFRYRPMPGDRGYLPLPPN